MSIIGDGLAIEPVRYLLYNRISISVFVCFQQDSCAWYNVIGNSKL